MSVEGELLVDKLLHCRSVCRLLFLCQFHLVVGQAPYFHQVLFALVLVAETFSDKYFMVDVYFVAVHVVFKGSVLLWPIANWTLDKKGTISASTIEQVVFVSGQKDVFVDFIPQLHRDKHKNIAFTEFSPFRTSHNFTSRIILANAKQQIKILPYLLGAPAPDHCNLTMVPGNMITGQLNRVQHPHKVPPAKTEIIYLLIVVVLLGETVLHEQRISLWKPVEDLLL